MQRFKARRLHHQAGRTESRLEQLSLEDLSPGDVVIRVAYSSINYKDALAAAGLGKIIRSFPRIGGIDLAGTVISSAAPELKPDQEVIVHGFGIGVDHDGGHSQYARVPAKWVMPLPAGLDLFEAAAVGVAGYTAALALHWMEANGLAPERGRVVVNGATGGVAGVAIDMLRRRGYSVTAITSKRDSADYLRGLGTGDILFRQDLDIGTRPLEEPMWAGAIDSVGGEMLAWLTRTMQPDGVIASFGNAGGAELKTTVLPFILRGIRLIGINANSPMPLRREVWGKIATIYRPAHLREIADVIDLERVPETMDSMLRGAHRGRAVIHTR